MLNRFKQKRKHNAQCTCSVCQAPIDVPLGYGSLMPTFIEELSKKERKRRVVLTDDVCVLDEEHFFVNGCLELPIIGEDNIFTWNVWCHSARIISFGCLMRGKTRLVSNLNRCSVGSQQTCPIIPTQSI